MTAYVIVEVETVAPELMEQYRKLAPHAIAVHGGRYLVRGGACEALEGDWRPQRIVILEFDDVERAKAWWSSQEYREAKALRQRAGHTNMIVVEGV